MRPSSALIRSANSFECRRWPDLSRCEQVEQKGCRKEGDEIAEVDPAECSGNGPDETRGPVHERNRDEHRCNVCRQRRDAPRPSSIRAWLHTPKPKEEGRHMRDCRPRREPVYI